MSTTTTQPADPTVGLRWLEKKDVDPALAVERQAHEFEDPDFQVPQMPPYAWDRDDLMAAVRQYRCKASGMPDTRAWVAETLVEVENKDGTKAREPRVVGTLVYEIEEDGYEILLLSATADHVRKAMLAHLLGKADRSPGRKRLTFVAPDGDWATLKFLMSNGFSVKLVPNPNPTGFDGWFCERKAAETKAPAKAA